MTFLNNSPPIIIDVCCRVNQTSGFHTLNRYMSIVSMLQPSFMHATISKSWVLVIHGIIRTSRSGVNCLGLCSDSILFLVPTPCSPCSLGKECQYSLPWLLAVLVVLGEMSILSTLAPCSPCSLGRDVNTPYRLEGFSRCMTNLPAGPC